MWKLQSRGARTAVSDTRLFRSKGRGYSGTVISEYVSIGPIAVPEELDAQKLNFDAAVDRRDGADGRTRPRSCAHVLGGPLSRELLQAYARWGASVLGRRPGCGCVVADDFSA